MPLTVVTPPSALRPLALQVVLAVVAAVAPAVPHTLKAVNVNVYDCRFPFQLIETYKEGSNLLALEKK